MIGRLDDFPGVACGAWQMRPHSSGYVCIQNSDPMSAPLINPNYLADPRDRQVLIAALRAARAILQSPPLAPFMSHELFPGAAVASDEDWLEFARNFGNSSYHLVGTCKMGPASDANAVVDPRLRVHGVGGLRLVDASIMPTMPSANTHAATMMIAEKEAAMMIEDDKFA